MQHRLYGLVYFAVCVYKLKQLYFTYLPVHMSIIVLVLFHNKH